jgi:hypothetical protein
VDTQATRAAITNAAAALTFSRSNGVRQGFMCCFGSSHPNGPCKACQRAEARRAAQAVTE